MRLVADIGGTHCRFALADDEGKLSRVETFKAANYATLEQAVETYLNAGNCQPETACLAVAGPTTHQSMVMTNLSWHSSSAQLNSRFGFRLSAFINDFEAIALSIPALEAADFLPVANAQSNSAQLDLTLPVSILGPGTGLGVAQLIPSGKHFHAIATEGGHTSLQAATHKEQAVFAYWQGRGIALSRESFLSGPGLLRLYTGLCALEDSECAADSGDSVSQLAARGDGLAAQALDMFLSLLGSAAGDQALACGSRGGVILAGGILPKMRDQLLNGRFRERFEAKAPMQHYLQRIATNLIVHPNPGLLGASRRTLTGTSGD
ncbi:MAG TPA: glucokinase [Spongiibacteraceae bacterium]|nr:glucokinase [Spongiibacteraceae bacterium]HCS27006.1 glucokinase [Spongiibacteraceae bacterium]